MRTSEKLTAFAVKTALTPFLIKDILHLDHKRPSHEALHWALVESGCSSQQQPPDEESMVLSQMGSSFQWTKWSLGLTGHHHQQHQHQQQQSTKETAGRKPHFIQCCSPALYNPSRQFSGSQNKDQRNKWNGSYNSDPIPKTSVFIRNKLIICGSCRPTCSYYSKSHKML